MAWHIRLRDGVRRLRRRLAAPVEVALRADLEAREQRREAEVHALREELARLRADGEAALREGLAGLRAEGEASRRELLARLERVSRLEAAQAAAEAAAGAQRRRCAELDAAVAAAAEALLARPVLPGAEAARPRVSVVLPTRDRRALVQEAIRSVQAQTFPGWELLVVDDASVDGTPEALTPFLADPRIRLLRGEGRGQCAARNLALRQARGELVAYLDADNLWFPGFLAAAVRAFDEEPALESAYGVVVADAAYFDGARVLFRPFDRAVLLERSTIDVGAFVHRRKLFEELGGFDEALTRLVDWDLVLRYTERTPPRPLAVLSTFYRTTAPDRMTDRALAAPNIYRIRRKWLRRPAPPGPHVLYAVWHHRQLTETYIQGELRMLSRLGARIELWCETQGSRPFGDDVPVHGGDLGAAIDRVRPDVVHAHWIDNAVRWEAAVAARGLPMTARAHSFETTPATLQALLERPSVRRIYAFPHQASLVADARVRPVRAAFDPAQYGPVRAKDRRLVVRTGAALPSKDLELFLALAGELPSHRFVLVAGTCQDAEPYADELRRTAARLRSPAELRFDLEPAEVAPLVARAGLYLHTAAPPGHPHATPIGMPISIAEAMATGAHVLVRDLPPLRDYVGDAGSAYRDAEEAARLVRETLAWSDADWERAWRTSVDRGFSLHAGELVLHPILEDWCALAAERRSGPDRLEAAVAASPLLAP